MLAFAVSPETTLEEDIIRQVQKHPLLTSCLIRSRYCLNNHRHTLHKA